MTNRQGWKHNLSGGGNSRWNDIWRKEQDTYVLIILKARQVSNLIWFSFDVLKNCFKTIEKKSMDNPLCALFLPSIPPRLVTTTQIKSMSNDAQPVSGHSDYVIVNRREDRTGNASDVIVWFTRPILVFTVSSSNRGDYRRLFPNQSMRGGMGWTHGTVQ